MTFQYTVKFVCGPSPGREVARGRYFTAINVHNPWQQTVKFRKKFALPGEQAETGGRFTDFFSVHLRHDQVLEIACRDIMEHTNSISGAPFRTGFVVLESPVELDVVAVYTAGGGNRVRTMDVERVPSRRLEECLPDLVPVPDDNGSFCRRDESNLTVTVKNQGECPAGPSTTVVDFGTSSVSMATPALGPGDSIDLAFPIPTGCFDPDCEFKITVDANNVVVESNEGNNVVTDRCIG